MDINLQTENQLKKITIKPIESVLATEIFKSISSTLPEWLRYREAETEHEDKPNRLFFAASIDNKYAGIITFNLSTTSNAHIDYMGLNQPDLLSSVGRKLLLAVENYCYEHGYTSLTVETPSPKKTDSNNLNTYYFYEDSGYKTLFETYTHDTNQLMVYLQKLLSLDDFTFIDLTHAVSSEVPHWGIDVGFKYNARFIQNAESPGKVKFRVQRLEMSAGIGTHMDAPCHCFENAPSIEDIPLKSLITACSVIDVSSKAHERYGVTVNDVMRFEEEYGIIPKNAFVIVHTGWDERWKEPEKYRNEKIFPYLTIEAAEFLLSRNIAGLGIDTLSPDAFGSDFPVHQLILGADKYIIENVANAKQLDPIGSFTFALPIKIKDGTEAPMRLVGLKRKQFSKK